MLAVINNFACRFVFSSYIDFVTGKSFDYIPTIYKRVIESEESKMNLDKPCKPKVIGKNVMDYIKRQQELKDRKDAVEADRAKEIYVSISKVD